MALDVGAFLVSVRGVWLLRGATSLTHLLGWMQEGSEHLSPKGHRASALSH